MPMLQKKIRFEYYAPHAQKVAVAGSFNGWSPEKNPMTKYRNGKWKAGFNLPPGRHQYRYWVDGSWQNDQRPVECVPNPFGTWNCVIVVQ